MEDQAELRTVVNSAELSATVATRARIVLWRAEERLKKTAPLAGVSRPRVDLWLACYGADGIGGLLTDSAGWHGSRYRVIRSRILALSQTSPSAETGLSHWSSREMAAFITRTEKATVSHHYVAKLWRDNGLKRAARHHEPGTIPRQAIWRGTLTSVKVLITQIRDYIAYWNTTQKPFAWAATADEILAKPQFVQVN